jgi:hypothetical protein
VDAYILSTGATEAAVAALGAGVGSTGPARVVLPLIGAYALYVAVEGADSGELATNVAAVIATEGVTGAVTFQPSASAPSGPPPGWPPIGWPPVSFPTYAEVSVYLGLSKLTTLPGLSASVYNAAMTVTGVIGAAAIVGGGVLVEVTGEDVETVATLLDSVGGLTGVTAEATMVGATELGFGFTPMSP